MPPAPSLRDLFDAHHCGIGACVVGARVGAWRGIGAARFLVKDCIDVQGFPSSRGLPLLACAAAESNADVVEALLNAGAVCCGKTNMDELSLGVTGANGHYGNVRNALNGNCVSGGSSAGSAVAVALGAADFALGTDTVGSVRIPAALNNLVGFRPSLGRYSRAGIAPVSSSKDVCGTIAPTVGVIAEIDCVLAGGALHGNPDTARIGIVPALWQGVSGEVASACASACKRLETQGWRLVEIEASDVASASPRLNAIVGLHEFHETFGAYLERRRVPYSIAELFSSVASTEIRDLHARFLDSGARHRPSARLYREAVGQVATLRSSLLKAMTAKRTNFLMHPTTLGGATAADTASRSNASYMYMRNAGFAAILGFPAITVPMSLSANGCGLGIEICGAPGADAEVIGAGLMIERVIQ